MHKLSFLTTLTLGGLLVLGGCHMNISDSGVDDEWDDDWDIGDGTCGGGSPGAGEWGESCDENADCAPGLTCDENIGSCVPAPCEPQPCTADTDCSSGFFCDEGLGECVPAGLCATDEDCGEGYVCDEPQSTCVPDETPPPTCGDMQTEIDCVQFGGCEPVYAGVDCSCGQDCECTGGEPGCVCASFEFFKCEAVAAP
jgi:Cys-rich repeat protein